MTLADFPITLTLAASDLGRARAWYADRLGLGPTDEEGDVLIYRLGGSNFVLYQTASAGTARNTVGIWTVADLRGQVTSLRARGVVFESQVDASDGSFHAWFTDSEGNTIGVVERPDDELPDWGLRPLLAASDIARARAWYSQKLGLEPVREYGGGELLRYSSAGQPFGLYRTPSAGTAKNTVAGWQVADLRALATQLRARGVAFEEYDFGEERTVDGILTRPDGSLNSWIRDSEGNILAIDQDPPDRPATPT